MPDVILHKGTQSETYFYFWLAPHTSYALKNYYHCVVGKFWFIDGPFPSLQSSLSYHFHLRAGRRESRKAMKINWIDWVYSCRCLSKPRILNRVGYPNVDSIGTHTHTHKQFGFSACIERKLHTLFMCTVCLWREANCLHVLLAKHCGKPHHFPSKKIFLL